MNSSPFDENPRGRQRLPRTGSHALQSPGPARQLFTNHTPTVNGRQSGLRTATPPTRPSSSRSTAGTPGSTHRTAAVVKMDHSNEIIRGDLNSVRYELETLKEERQLEKIKHEQELRALEASVEEQAKRVDALESDKRFLYEKQKELGGKLQKAKDSFASQKQELERQIRRLKSENNEFRELVNDKQEAMDDQDRQHRRKIDEYESRHRALVQTSNELREEMGNKNRTMEEIQAKLESKDREVQELEVDLLNVKARAGDQEMAKVLRKELGEQVNHIKTLESTNRKQLAELKTLRETNRSLELVDEEKRALEGKLKMLDELREGLSASQLRVSVLEDERNTWQSYFQREGLEFDSPESLARALVEERVEKVALLEKAGRLNPELLEKEGIIQELEGELRLLKEALEKSRESSAKDSKARQRMERQRALALKEAQFLREQLKSISTEESMYNQGSYDEQKTARIQELEGLLEAYKAEIEGLKAAASGAEVATSKKRTHEENSSDERLGELIRRNRQLQNDIMQLRQKEAVLNREVEALQIRISSMENTSTRILQLKDNPTAREQAVKVSTLNGLREENAALFAQLEGRTEGIRRVPMATLENCRAEVKSMEKVVAEKDKRMTRLKEIWSAKSLEFREAVYSLLGWKLDFMPNGRVKVTHMFGNESQSIEFDGEKGTMKVAGGPDSMFHKEIRNHCSFWMARQSIPCLLASILLEQYEKTTRAQMM